MAAKAHSLLLRSFLVLSFAVNILLFLRVVPGEINIRNTSHRFNHRAVSLKQEADVSTATVPAPSFEQPRSEIPIYDASKEAAPRPAKALPPDDPPEFDKPVFVDLPENRPPVAIRLGQYTQVAQVNMDEEFWTVYEDLSRRDGDIVFQSTKTQARKVFPKTAEASFYEGNSKYPKYAGIPVAQFGLAASDMLADQLLKDGEPIEQRVLHTVPPMLSKQPRWGVYTAPQWTSFLGTVEASDTAPVFASGNTKSYQPVQYFPEFSRYNKQRFEGRIGGWMPAVRKVLMPNNEDDNPPQDYFEVNVFGDVDARDPFIIQTWHRTSLIRNNTIVKTVYGHSYPRFPPTKPEVSPEEFYRALFRFGEYWENRLSDMALLTLPDASWVEMPKFAFARELVIRPGGNYPKYGAVDRDYAGSEYDGFQDVFTSSVSANLEWGRFAQAWNVIDNYFSLFVGKDGSINMRGPEIGQYGLTLSLLAKYARYTGETDLLWKHKDKIIAHAKLLIDLHDQSLKLNTSAPGYGLIHGWSESDACLKARPDTYWQPYFSNSAMAVRGLRDISQLEIFREFKVEWTRRASMLTNRTIESLTQSIRTNSTPPYVPPLPGTNLTFRQSIQTQNPSPQAWAHRLYTELLHAAILPKNLSNAVHDTMRGYGATSMGVVANVDVPSRQGRDILGFISYGHALSLLYNDRIDEFILFLYTHRYHVHSRGAWTAGEVTDLVGGNAVFCMPAQFTIPTIMRWALVLEHPDEEILYLGRGVPRAWLQTGHEIGIRQAPTRWGRVDFVIQYSNSGDDLGGKKVRAQVRFVDRVPHEVEVKLRLPKGSPKLTSITVNGRPVEMTTNEAVVVKLTGRESPLIIEGV